MYEKKVIEPGCPAYAYADVIDTVLKDKGLLVQPKRYEFSDPEMSYRRFFNRHYDRMKAAGASAEESAEYAKKRTQKGEYYQQRTQPEAFDNATRRALIFASKRTPRRSLRRNSQMPRGRCYPRSVIGFAAWMTILWNTLGEPSIYPRGLMRFYEKC
jgi:hypothetical protein